MKKIKLSKLKISYFHRPGKRGTIIFVHGLGCSKDDFINVTKAKELRDYELFSFDWPGAGESTYPKSKALEIKDLVKIINAFAIKFSVKRFILVGHSVGAVAALLYVVKYPKKVAGFLNVEGSLVFQNAWWSRKIKKAGFDIFRKKLFPDMVKDLKESKNRGFKRYSHQLSNVSIKSYFDFSISHAKICKNEYLLKKFLKLKIPKVFIHGAKNKVWLPVIKELKKNSSIVKVIPKSHHFSFIDNPNEFYKILLAFLVGIDK